MLLFWNEESEYVENVESMSEIIIHNDNCTHGFGIYSISLLSASVQSLDAIKNGAN